MTLHLDFTSLYLPYNFLTQISKSNLSLLDNRKMHCILYIFTQFASKEFAFYEGRNETIQWFYKTVQTKKLTSLQKYVGPVFAKAVLSWHFLILICPVQNVEDKVTKSELNIG